MTTIYENAKRRESWAWLYPCLFIGLGTFVLIHSPLIGLGILGLGVWTIASEFRLHRRLPLELRILDGGGIQVRAKYGTHTYNAEQLTTIRYIYNDGLVGRVGRLFLNADGTIWYFVCTTTEAENVIAALVSINPALKVERVEFDPD